MIDAGDTRGGGFTKRNTVKTDLQHMCHLQWHDISKRHKCKRFWTFSILVGTNGNTHFPLSNLPYPTVGSPKCFMRFFTSSDSSCLSERRYRFRRCWLMRSARLGGLVFFLLSRLAHCMLFFRRSGCSDWSLPVEFLWAVFSFQDSLRSRGSSQSSTDTWDWSAWQQVVNTLTVFKVVGWCFHRHFHCSFFFCISLLAVEPLYSVKVH